MAMRENVAVDCGWGRLILAQTFADARDLAQELAQEVEGRRDIAFYVEEPHVVLARAPLALFLDPSHTFRLSLNELAAPPDLQCIRPAESDDEADINRIYAARRMVPLREGHVAAFGDPENGSSLWALAVDPQANVPSVG